MWFYFRPLPPVPNMEIPEEFANKAADDLRVWINYVLSIASDITIARNPIRLLQVFFHHLWQTICCIFLFLHVMYLTVHISFVFAVKQVSLVLWAISYVGTLINSLTLVYIGERLTFSCRLYSLWSWLIWLTNVSLFLSCRSSSQSFFSYCVWEVPRPHWWESELDF